MPSRTVLDLASFFPAKSSGQQAIWDHGVRFSGFYIGENIVLTSAHNLHDVRWNLDPLGNPINWSLTNATSSGVYRNSTSVVAPWTFNSDAGFYSFVNSEFAANRNPYQSGSIANNDTAWAVSTTTVATRDLIGAGVFYGVAVANSAAIGTTVTLEYRLNGSFGSVTGNLTSLGLETASAGMTAVSGMSGGPWASNFRAIRTSDTYAFGVQSNHVNGATATLISPDLFDSIMAQLAIGKTGSQSSQPTNYLHGSDGADAFLGSFRPDVIYGNAGTDTLNDGEVSKSYWANDHLFGGDGDDRIVSGRGFDLLYGGDQSKPGGTVNITTDGIDIADYSTQFINRPGIEIRVGTVPNTTYKNLPNYDKAVFVKDLVSNDIDTLISIETVYSSLGSDTLAIDSLLTARTPGVGLQGTLSKVVFNSTKTSGEIDKIDASNANHFVIINLSDSAQDIYSRGAVDKSIQIPGQPDAWFFNPLVTVAPHTISASTTSGARIEVLNANYIVGSNLVQTTYDPTSTLWGDWLEGNPNVAETFIGTKGQDTYVVGNGDVLVFSHWANMTADQAAQVGNWADYAYGDILFNGLHLRIFDYEGNNIYRCAYSGFTLTAVYNSTNSTIIITDDRDGSVFRIEGYLPSIYGIQLQNQPAFASAATLSQSPLADQAEAYPAFGGADMFGSTVYAYDLFF